MILISLFEETDTVDEDGVIGNHGYEITKRILINELNVSSVDKSSISLFDYCNKYGNFTRRGDGFERVRQVKSNESIVDTLIIRMNNCDEFACLLDDNAKKLYGHDYE